MHRHMALITDPAIGHAPIKDSEVWIEVDAREVRAIYEVGWRTLRAAMPDIVERAAAAFGNETHAMRGLKRETHVKFATRCMERCHGMFELLALGTGNMRLPMREVSTLRRIADGSHLAWWLYPPKGIEP